MATPISNCQTKVSTIFIFETPAFQTASEMIYLNKKDELASSINGVLPAGKNHNVNLIFKTDFERMQYLIGLYGRTSQGRR